MLISYIRENKGKSLLIAGIILMWVVLGVSFKLYGYEETWKLWRVPTISPPFLDLRSITGGAESFRAGYEPTINNPYDPYKRLFNYPFVWRLLFYTNIDQSDTVWLGISLIVIFFIAVISFSDHPSVTEAVFILFFIFSPTAMLLYERGNIDMLVFAVCVAVIFFADTSGFLSLFFLLSGVALKLYPVFGLFALWKSNSKKSLQVTELVVLLSIIYVVLTHGSFRSSWLNTQGDNDISYGSQVFFVRYAPIILDWGSHTFSPTSILQGINIIPRVLVVTIVAVTLVFVKQKRNFTLSLFERNIAGFRMGAGIYIGTFFLGNNFDYRLIFLVLTIPQLLQWMKDQERRDVYALAILTLALIFISPWYLFAQSFALPSVFKEGLFILDEFLNWTLVWCMCCFLFMSLPNWTKELLSSKNKMVTD